MSFDFFLFINSSRQAFEAQVTVILSKGFETKKLAENERLKYPDRERRKIGIGVVREPSQH